MKKIYRLLLSSICVLSLLACQKNKPDEDDSNKDDIITINYYIDFNYASDGEIYYCSEVKRNSLISDIPEDPKTNMFKDFTHFIGWSKFQIIDNDDDLWDFKIDKVNPDFLELKLYGIWTD